MGKSCLAHPCADQPVPPCACSPVPPCTGCSAPAMRRLPRLLVFRLCHHPMRRWVTVVGKRFRARATASIPTSFFGGPQRQWRLALTPAGASADVSTRPSRCCAPCCAAAGPRVGSQLVGSTMALRGTGWQVSSFFHLFPLFVPIFFTRP